MSSPNNLLIRRLYRSLLKASKPFTPPSSNNAVVLSCLLHRSYARSFDEDLIRTVMGDDYKKGGGEEKEEEQQQQQLSQSHRALYGRLLHELFHNDGDASERLLLFPHHIDSSTTKLRDMIRREFRGVQSTDCVSSAFDSNTQQQVAFLALRELNKKIAWAEELLPQQQQQQDNDTSNNTISSSIIMTSEETKQQAARHVSPLQTVVKKPPCVVKPGTYLLAHPLLDGFFHQTVVLIVDTYDDDYATSGEKGTYGLVVNRVTENPKTGKNMSLRQVLRTVPNELDEAFGGSMVKTGGPVHEAIQMFHLCSPEQEELGIGGKVISMVPKEDDDADAVSTALDSDRALCYDGDILKAAQAVLKGDMDRDDVSIFVGASCWTPGQLEREIEQGCWLPCRGPLDIAHSGTCEHLPTEAGKPRPKADLWLSMMSACGEDEAKLAHLLHNVMAAQQQQSSSSSSSSTSSSKHGAACDDFDDF